MLTYLVRQLFEFGFSEMQYPPKRPKTNFSAVKLLRSCRQCKAFPCRYRKQIWRHCVLL